MSLALLVPGQGGQHPEMLRWLDRGAETDSGTGTGTVAVAAPGPGSPNPPPAIDAGNLVTRAVGPGWRARLADPQRAADNAFVQPLITAVALQAWAQVSHALAMPQDPDNPPGSRATHAPRLLAVAGYSVGEIAAAALAGAIDADGALSLVQQRAALMDACDAARGSGLMGVSGLPEPQVMACAEARSSIPGQAVWLAIRLDPQRAVLGGPREALLALQPVLEAAGARCQPLPVALASHTPLLDAAVAPWRAVLEGAGLRAPRVALACNATGSVLRQPAALVGAFGRQIAVTVRWDEVMDALAERGPRCVLELGPGTALSRAWNERHPAIPARSVDEFGSAQAVAAWVRQQSQA